MAFNLLGLDANKVVGIAIGRTILLDFSAMLLISILYMKLIVIPVRQYFFLFFHHPCIFFMFISYLFQSPDDSAISISNILRHHETEYLASLEVLNFLLIFKCLIIYSLVLTLNSHINRSLTPICQITHSRYRLVWEIYLLKTFLIFLRFSKQDLS